MSIGLVVAVIIGVLLGVVIGAVPLGLAYICLKRYAVIHLSHAVASSEFLQQIEYRNRNYRIKLSAE